MSSSAPELDGTTAGAIRTASSRGRVAREDVTVGRWLEELRDRIVVRSQVGKRKLDAARLRRQLDRKLAEVGERFIRRARDGRAVVPSDMADLVGEARQLEEMLEAHQADIRALESEKV